jgi:ribose transport system permease protein
MRSMWPSRMSLEESWPVLTFAALLLLDVALKGRFSRFDLQTLCVNVLPLVLISLGQFFVVLTRGVDLSLGPISSVAGSCAALLLTRDMATGFAVALLAGAAAGFCNGLLVVRFTLPSIVVTLGSMSVWQGVALLILPNPGGDVPPELSELLSSDYGVPTSLLILVLLWLAAAWVMSTRFGLHLRAIGDDEAAARMSGVAVRRVKLAAYVLAGLTAAAGGVMLAIATSSGSPTVGDDYILLSVATVVLGGVSLGGGAGNALGVVMGALIVTIIGSLLYFANLSSFYQSIINGVILLAVVGSRSMRQLVGFQLQRLRHAG